MRSKFQFWWNYGANMLRALTNEFSIKYKLFRSILNLQLIHWIILTSGFIHCGTQNQWKNQTQRHKLTHSGSCVGFLKHLLSYWPSIWQLNWLFEILIHMFFISFLIDFVDTTSNYAGLLQPYSSISTTSHSGGSFQLKTNGAEFQGVLWSLSFSTGSIVNTSRRHL